MRYIYHLIALSLIIVLAGCSAVPKIAITTRNDFADTAAEQAYTLSADIREVYKSHVALMAERDFSQLKRNTEAAIAASSSEDERHQIMANYYGARSIIEQRLIEDARRLKIHPDTVAVLGDAILAINDAANREAKLNEEALQEAVSSGFLDSLVQIIQTIRDKYFPTMTPPQTEVTTPSLDAAPPAPRRLQP